MFVNCVFDLCRCLFILRSSLNNVYVQGSHIFFLRASKCDARFEIGGSSVVPQLPPVVPQLPPSKESLQFGFSSSGQAAPSYTTILGVSGRSAPSYTTISSNLFRMKRSELHNEHFKRKRKTQKQTQKANAHAKEAKSKSKRKSKSNSKSKSKIKSKRKAKQKHNQHQK